MRPKRILVAAICVACAPAFAPAQDQRQGDFTFRRIAVGESGVGRRITVQIDPEEQAARLAAAPRVPQTPPPATAERPDAGDVGQFAWF